MQLLRDNLTVSGIIFVVFRLRMVSNVLNFFSCGRQIRKGMEMNSKKVAITDETILSLPSPLVLKAYVLFLMKKRPLLSLILSSNENSFSDSYGL